MDNTYAPTENKEQEKIKVESIDTIVTMHGDKPYYENKYREVGDKCYHIGYSSYYLDVALEYRKKYFEVVERESDWIPCSVKLPEESDHYMACIYDEDVDEYDFRKTWFAHEDDYDMDESEWRELQPFEKVIAWMPLPEPYKEEE